MQVCSDMLGSLALKQYRQRKGCNLVLGLNVQNMFLSWMFMKKDVFVNIIILVRKTDPHSFMIKCTYLFN